MTRQEILDAIHEANETLYATVDRLDKTITRLDEAIRGNGHPGLTLRVDRLEQRARLGGVALLAGLPIAWDFLKRQLGIH